MIPRVLKTQISISTHALMWSATYVENNGDYSFKISTHALTWSATSARRITSRFFSFQLTRSRGARPTDGIAPIPPYEKFQLTRSRGARLPRKSRQGRNGNFNSRAHVERDVLMIVKIEQYMISTHALTWSATIFTFWHLRHLHYFNSRAHVERDYPYFVALSDPKIFQLTRSRGARHVVMLKSFRGQRFQLTRSRGARPSSVKLHC